MSESSISKLFITVVRRTKKCFLQEGFLPKENPVKVTSDGAIQRQVITVSCYANVILQRHVSHVQQCCSETQYYHRVSTGIMPQHQHVQMQQHYRAKREGPDNNHCAHIGHICNYRNLCTMASQGEDAATSNACGNANGRHAEALAVQLQALLMATPNDQEALKALEALVDQITAPDDPEGLLMGAACLKLATIHASKNSRNILKGLSYALKAVKAYEPRGPSLKLATCLYMLALVYITMGDYKKALIDLEQSAAVMKRMKVTRCDEYCVALKHDVQSVMGEACDQFCNAVNFEVQSLFGLAKTHLGMHAEAAAHIHKSVKIKQKLLQAGSPDLGSFYFDAAEALQSVKDHKAAGQLCLRAVKIFSKCYGLGSRQEGKVRSLLSKIYRDLGNYEDSLSESESARYIWKHLGDADEAIASNLSSERLLVHLQRWNEAMLRVEEVIQATVFGSKYHTIGLISAARICALSNKDVSATSYCKRALDSLEHQGACTQTAGNLVLLSMVYEEKKLFEQAALLCEKAKEMFEQCFGCEAAMTAADLEGKTGCLLIHAGKTLEAIPHLESSLSKLKCIPGKDLVYVHFYLGLAYPQVERFQESLEHFEAAKTALSSSTEADAKLTVSIYSNLAATYSALNRLDEAIECQKVAADLVKKNEVEDYTLEEVEARLKSYIKEAEIQNECNGDFRHSE